MDAEVALGGAPKSGIDVARLPSAELRAIIKAWTRAAWKASGKTQVVLAELQGQDPVWFSQRATSTTNIVMTQQQLSQLSRDTRHALTPEVIEARAELDARRTRSRFALDARAIAALPDECSTAEAEMTCLIELAHTHITGGNADRNSEFMRRRFGVGAPRGCTLAEVGDAFGLTRERVRQIEAKMLSRLADAAEGLATPMLDQVLASAQKRAGMPLAAVEAELRDQLGNVPLTEALRFLQEIRPSEAEIGHQTVLVYGQGRVKVLATAESQTRLAQLTSILARKIVSFSGACLVGDLRAYLEATTREPVSSQDLDRLVDALPLVDWLDAGRRWFWFAGEEMSPMVTRCAVILALARAPVDMETIYAGLVREMKRERGSDAEPYCDGLPPSAVVQTLLDRHPAFRRARASSFELVVPFDPLEQMEGFHRAVVATLEANGGVATRDELRQVVREDGTPLTHGYLSVTLYLSCFIERLGLSVYAIRGRPLTQQARLAAFARANAQLAEHGFGARPPPGTNPIVATIPVNEALKRNRNVNLRRADVPADAAGDYRVAGAGYHVKLIDDTHSIRLTGIGAAITDAIKQAAVGDEIRFEFDTAQREVRFEVRGRNAPRSTA